MNPSSFVRSNYLQSIKARNSRFLPFFAKNKNCGNITIIMKFNNEQNKTITSPSSIIEADVFVGEN